MVLQNGLSGHPFGGADVPGFYGMPTDALSVQFYQLGSYFPFFRAHDHIDYPNREPWLESPRVFQAIRESVQQRHDMIWYMYTLFYNHT